MRSGACVRSRVCAERKCAKWIMCEACAKRVCEALNSAIEERRCEQAKRVSAGEGGARGGIRVSRVDVAAIGVSCMQCVHVLPVEWERGHTWTLSLAEFRSKSGCSRTFISQCTYDSRNTRNVITNVAAQHTPCNIPQNPPIEHRRVRLEVRRTDVQLDVIRSPSRVRRRVACSCP